MTYIKIIIQVVFQSFLKFKLTYLIPIEKLEIQIVIKSLK